MTQRPLGKGSGIIAVKSYFRLEKWLKPVNRNMIATARSPAAFHEERRLTPRKPTALRTRNEKTRMNRDVMCLLSAGAPYLPSAYAAVHRGRSTPVASPTFCLPAVAEGQWLDSNLLKPLLHLLRFSGWSRLFITVSSLHSGAALNHPHYSRTTPALLPHFDCGDLEETCRAHVPSATMPRSWGTGM